MLKDYGGRVDHRIRLPLIDGLPEIIYAAEHGKHFDSENAEWTQE